MAFSARSSLASVSPRSRRAFAQQAPRALALVALLAGCASVPPLPLRFALEPPPITEFRYGPAALAVHGPFVAVVDAAPVLDKGPARLAVLRRNPLRFQKVLSINIRALPTSSAFAVAFESSHAVWLVVSGPGGAHVARFASNADGSNWTEKWDRLPSVGAIPAIAAGPPGTLYVLDAEYYRVVEIIWSARRRRPLGSARDLGAPHGLWYDKGRLFTLFLSERIEIVSMEVAASKGWTRTVVSPSPGDDTLGARTESARWREGLFTFDASRRTLYAYKPGVAQGSSLPHGLATWRPDGHPWLVGGVNIASPNLAAANGNRLCLGSKTGREIRCFEAIFKEPIIKGGPLPKANR